mgnify:CR=1 FL=1
MKQLILSQTQSIYGGIVKVKPITPRQSDYYSYVMLVALILIEAGFKHAIQDLANEINLEIVVAHYPSYASKWNPIEHRVFPHVTRSMSGAKLTNIERVKALIERTKTTTGLKVTVGLINKTYQIGKKFTKDSLSALSLSFDEDLPKWNYSIKPLTVF